jgi:Zn-dependent protease with chaperone function
MYLFVKIFLLFLIFFLWLCYTDYFVFGIMRTLGSEQISKNMVLPLVILKAIILFQWIISMIIIRMLVAMILDRWGPRNDIEFEETTLEQFRIVDEFLGRIDDPADQLVEQNAIYQPEID